jgi:hypothetical protein
MKSLVLREIVKKQQVEFVVLSDKKNRVYNLYLDETGITEFLKLNL